MELKEFSHKGEAIEKEIKKEFQFMGRTKIGRAHV